jgi:putative two-component system response regulator
MAASRILIVDDQVSVRSFFRNLLQPLQAEISEAGDGLEALIKAQNGRFDLILTDFDMPNLNGLELCRHLKRNAATQAIPVIMISTFDSDYDVDRGFQAGATHYLSKKRAGKYLLATVGNILATSRFQREKLIMVVDDSPVVRTMVEQGLLKAGFQVVTAQDGRQAQHMLASKKPDLILCDAMMPGMSGRELCLAINDEQRFRDIPFVVMSSHTDRSHMRRMIQSGAAAYIIKPFNLEQLVIMVEKILSDQFLLLLKEKERLDTERKMLLAGITSLVSALEVRDQYTKGHSEAVAGIIAGMMTIAGADRGEIETAALGGRLHDVGKIGIRDNVLAKCGPLTDAEYVHIKTHPELGADIIRSIPSLADILPMILHHHERMDGKGYPHGLKANAIPYLARMAAVADTYNALTSDRPYRRALPQGKALEIMLEMKGNQLCPLNIDLFLQWVSSANGLQFHRASYNSLPS